MAQRKKTTRRKATSAKRQTTARSAAKRAAKTAPETVMKAPSHYASKAASFYSPAAFPSFEQGQNFMEEIQKSMGAFFPKTDFKIPEPKMMESVMSQGKTQFEKLSQDAASIGRDHFEALIKSGSLFAKGFEELLRTSAELAQDAAEKQAQFVKQAMGAKTLNEWAEVQNKIAQTQFDDFMSGATRISELGVKVLTKSTEPLNEQINKTVQKASQAMAA